MHKNNNTGSYWYDTDLIISGTLNLGGNEWWNRFTRYTATPLLKCLTSNAAKKILEAAYACNYEIILQRIEGWKSHSNGHHVP